MSKKTTLTKAQVRAWMKREGRQYPDRYADVTDLSDLLADEGQIHFLRGHEDHDTTVAVSTLIFRVAQEIVAEAA